MLIYKHFQLHFNYIDVDFRSFISRSGVSGKEWILFDWLIETWDEINSVCSWTDLQWKFTNKLRWFLFAFFSLVQPLFFLFNNTSNIVRHDQNVVAFSMRTFTHHPMSFALHSDSDNAAEAIYWVTSHDHFVDLLNLWAIFILTMAFPLIFTNGTVRTFRSDVRQSRCLTRSRVPWASFLMTSSRSFRQTIQNINERINNKLWRVTGITSSCVCVYKL